MATHTFSDLLAAFMRFDAFQGSHPSTVYELKVHPPFLASVPCVRTLLLQISDFVIDVPSDLHDFPTAWIRFKMAKFRLRPIGASSLHNRLIFQIEAYGINKNGADLSIIEKAELATAKYLILTDEHNLQIKYRRLMICETSSRATNYCYLGLVSSIDNLNRKLQALTVNANVAAFLTFSRSKETLIRLLSVAYRLPGEVQHLAVVIFEYVDYFWFELIPEDKRNVKNAIIAAVDAPAALNLILR